MREGGGERETTRTGREIGTKRAREIQSRCRSSPASGYNQKSYSVSVAFGFLFVKPEPPSLTSVTDVLPQNRVRLFFALGLDRGQEECGANAARAAAAEGAGPRGAAPLPTGRPPGQSWAARRTKRLPLPPPRPRTEREGEGGMWEVEEEGVEGRCSRRDWAGSRRGGWGGGGAGRPRRTGRREGFLKPKINKLFLFTCGVGGGGEGGERALRPLLFPSPQPALCQGAPAGVPGESRRRHRHHRGRPGLPDPGCARCINRTRRGTPTPGPALRIEVQSARETRDSARPRRAPGFPQPGAPRTRAQPGARRRGGGGGCRHLSQASGLPPQPPNTHPERKAKEQEREDKRKDSTLRVRGWELPLPPREVKPLAAPLPRTHPPSHLSFFHLPATFHFSRLITLSWKVGGERCGG